MIDYVDVIKVSFHWNSLCGFYHVQAKTSQLLDSDTIGVLMPRFGRCKDVKVMILHDVTNVLDFIIYEANVLYSDLKTTYRRCYVALNSWMCTSSCCIIDTFAEIGRFVDIDHRLCMMTVSISW